MVKSNANNWDEILQFFFPPRIQQKKLIKKFSVLKFFFFSLTFSKIIFFVPKKHESYPYGILPMHLLSYLPGPSKGISSLGHSNYTNHHTHTHTHTHTHQPLKLPTTSYTYIHAALPFLCCQSCSCIFANKGKLNE
jgi:hypothetical protein